VDTTTSKVLEGQGTITYAIEDGVLSLLPYENKNEIANPFDMDEAFKAIYETVLMVPVIEQYDDYLQHKQWRNAQLQKFGGKSQSPSFNNLRLLGEQWPKNMNVTRKDGLDVDVIFIPFENDQ
jgi:hypothetical protein